MRQYAILKLLLAAFFLYFAWPVIPEMATSIEKIFWVSWISFFLLVIGANLATLLRITEPPIMEQETSLERRTLND